MGKLEDGKESDGVGQLSMTRGLCMRFAPVRFGAKG